MCVCVSPCLCLRRCLCLCFCVCFVYPAQGPGGETSVKARKGHHAHATARQRLALADACCGSADRARRRRTVRVASVEMGLELEPAGLFTVRNARSQRIVVLIVVLRATYNSLVARLRTCHQLGGFRAGQHVIGMDYSCACR